MARLRKQPTLERGRGPRDRRIGLSAVLGDTRPGHDDPELDRLWLDVRAEVDRLTMGTEFDLRRWVFLEGPARECVMSARREWLRAQLAGDERVNCEA